MNNFSRSLITRLQEYRQDYNQHIATFRLRPAEPGQPEPGAGEVRLPRVSLHQQVGVGTVFIKFKKLLRRFVYIL